MTDLDPLDRLVAEAEIRRVVARYCRGIDRMDLDLVRSCYHHDARDEHGSFSGPVDEYIEWVAGLLSKYDATMHFIGNQLVEFDDPDFVAAGRDVAYYVRAIQEATPAVNAGGLRCERGAAGDCTRVRPCFGDYRTPYEDDCLSENEERAWSSPIYVINGRR